MSRVSDAEKVNVWSARLERFQRSDLTVARFCETEGVSQAAFYAWRKKIANRSESRRKQKDARPRFQAVEVSAPVGKPEQRVATIRLAEGIEIELGSDLRVVDQIVESIVKRLYEERLATALQGGRTC
jgi:hypothetical protein